MLSLANPLAGSGRGRGATSCVERIHWWSLTGECLALFYFGRTLWFFAIRQKIQINSPEKVLLQHVTMMRQAAGTSRGQWARVGVRQQPNWPMPAAEYVFGQISQQPGSLVRVAIGASRGRCNKRRCCTMSEVKLSQGWGMGRSCSSCNWSRSWS